MSLSTGGTNIAGMVPNLQRHKIQKGHLFRKNGSWHVEFYQQVPGGNGVRSWRKTSSAIGRRDYPRERDIWDIFQGFMSTINDRYVRVAGMDPPFCAFVEEVYWKSDQFLSLSRSTTDEYRGMWKRYYLKSRLKDETLGSIRPVMINALLETIVRDHDISRDSIQHVKAFLSGVYSWARNHGHFDGANPVTGVRLPKARGRRETYAYGLLEELAIMSVLGLREKAAIATASFTGLSKAELQGLRWEDRIDGCLHIRRNVWEGIEKETKTESRAATVPIIPQLAMILDEYWTGSDRPAAGWVWPGIKGWHADRFPQPPPAAHP